MKNFRIYSVLLVAFFLFSNSDLLAQNHNNKKGSDKGRKEYYKKQEKNRKQVQKKYKNQRKDHYYSNNRKHNGPPHWAKAHGYHAKNHVYFRDYNTFYDPYRGGYVYLHKKKWLFSRNIPTFLIGVNLNSARVNYITDVPLNYHPERNYTRYVKQYPRDPKVQVNINLF